MKTSELENFSSSRLGIVVIGRNEAHHLAECLEAIPAGYPCVYVDSSSVDNSLAIASRYPIETIKLDNPPFSPAKGRNRGAYALLERFPSLKYLQFIDGDTVIAQQWFENGQRILENNAELAIVSGSLEEKNGSSSLYKIWCSLEWQNLSKGSVHCGGNCMVRVKDFVDLKGFNSDLKAGEEPEFCERLRRRRRQVLCTDIPMGVHDSSVNTFSKFWRRCERTGYAFQQIAALSYQRKWDLYRKENLSQWIYGVWLPLAILLLSIKMPWISIGLLAIYPVTLLRIIAKVRRRLKIKQACVYSIGCMISKFPGCIGAIRFYAEIYLNR